MTIPNYSQLSEQVRYATDRRGIFQISQDPWIQFTDDVTLQATVSFLDSPSSYADLLTLRSNRP